MKNYLSIVSKCKQIILKNSKNGFTLAEVLITLGIIGVVAALTMPSLITKHQKMVFAAKAKQTYSILSNALITSVAENGPMSEWNYGESSNAAAASSGSQKDLTYIVNTYFKPYFKIAEDIGFKSPGYHILLSNGMTLSFFTDGGVNANTNIYTPRTIYIVVSDNGNTIAYYSGYRDYSRHDLFFQVNGASKNTVYPFAWGNGVYDYPEIKSRDELINHSKYGCSKTKNKNKRYNCAALMLWDNWQIKDDYPW